MGKATPEHAALLRDARAKRLGLEGYIRILAYIRFKAVTSAGIAASFGIHHNTTAKLLRYMRRLGLIHRENWVRPSPHSRLVPKWRLGADGDVSMPIAEAPAKTPPNPMLIYLATVIEILSGPPITISEISEDLGMHKETVGRVLGMLREHGLSTIASYERPLSGPPVAQHRYLGITDAKWPGRGCMVAARKRWRTTHTAKQRHLRLIAATAGTSHTEREAALAA